MNSLKRLKHLKFALTLLAILFGMYITPAQAQISRPTDTLKRVVIKVTNQSGAALLNATVKVRDQGSGKVVTGTTNKEGIADIWVVPGRKLITASAVNHNSDWTETTVDKEFIHQFKLAKSR